MPAHAAKAVSSVTIEATVIRANGSREDLGVIARYDRNPLRRLLNRVRGLGSVRLNEDA